MEGLFRSALGPIGWTVMALVPPAILALYFLKLKRQPLEVPSTYLWTKVIEDLHVNSFWQKLRKSLLLLLQLALVALAALALLRPGWRGESLAGRQFIFLLDNSASMSTRDADGRSRLDAAKRRVADLIDQMGSDMSAMIITFAGQPDVIQEFTSNRRLLRQSLERVQPTSQTTAIRGALELADGLANPGRITVQERDIEVDATSSEPVELYILSDGRFESVEGFSLGNLRPKYLPLGGLETNNVALTALSAARSEASPDDRQAFVQAANFGGKEQAVTIDLRLDGRMVDAKQITVPPGDTAGTTFDLHEVAGGALEARIIATDVNANALELDDRAYAALEARREARVLLATPGNSWLEFALSTERARRLAIVEKISPDDLSEPEVKRRLQSEQIDLVIFDQCAPEESPAANTLYIGRLPPGEAWRGDGDPKTVVAPQIIDWQRAHPLLHLVEMGNVALYDTYVLQPPSGGKPLIESSAGPIMAIAPRDGYEDAVLGFEILGRDEDGAVTVNTNWPKRPSFPSFALNVLEYLAGGGPDAARVHPAGQPVEASLRPSEGPYAVRLPDGTERSAGASTGGKIYWSDTDQVGVYAVLDAEGETAARFAVNLLNAEESDVRLRPRQDSEKTLATVENLTIGYTDVEAEALRSPIRKELWPWFVAFALAVLTAEWYIYNRRVYI
ncbi:MAG: BatA and WFA domain-containing protein [Planctomycetales bacterium]|nr:BatA and WFA domain-containing protein [Planctomycetales bacterium]